MDDTKLKPALIGGALFGVLANVPYVDMANIACCALYIGGGVLASYLFFKGKKPFAKPYAEGAVVGLWTGVFGGIVDAIVATVVRVTGFGEDPEEKAAVLEEMESLGVEMPQWALEIMGYGEVTGLTIGVAVAAALVLFTIFGTVGGLLGAALFHEKEEA